jgi:hypothetical protein
VYIEEQLQLLNFEFIIIKTTIYRSPQPWLTHGLPDQLGDRCRPRQVAIFSERAQLTHRQL